MRAPGRFPKGLLLLAAVCASAVLLSCARATSGQVDAAGTRCRVLHVVDGDTLAVRVDGREERVRLIGVDTPEMRYDDPPAEFYAAEATAFTRRLAGRAELTLVAETGREDRDKYGRLLRYVYLEDGTLLNAEIIRQGYGFAYTRFPFAKMEEFRRHEREARAAGRGLWAD